MPIANCFVAPDCSPGSGDIIKLWSNESGIASDHMTVNIISSSQQSGHNYLVMANLLLPSIWSKEDISTIQTGLSRALANYFDIAIAKVHVVTNIVHSGLIVEAGREITW